MGETLEQTLKHPQGPPGPPPHRLVGMCVPHVALATPHGIWCAAGARCRLVWCDPAALTPERPGHTVEEREGSGAP